MKTLYLIRHSKSDWSDGSLNDFDRGLNKRGKKAIHTMAKVLKAKKIMPGLILSSSAKRARLTAKGLAKEIGYTGEITFTDTLYMAEPETILKYINDINDKYDTLFVVGHNPEITELSNMLINEYIDNVPTLGIVAVKLPIDHWRKFSMGEGKLKFFIYPKMFKE
ncbi:MAG: phosphohistidine phosphatase [Epsilonproteobacteria bacterium (ex Lamellibrachia satsuma)]|nr:MAG: phosphohistidine phosphatase [Epsilonproteobacteria bacterium (ex Lamellibrachia satsuma)]